MVCGCGRKKGRRRRRAIQAKVDHLIKEREAATASGDMAAYRKCTEDMKALLVKEER